MVPGVVALSPAQARIRWRWSRDGYFATRIEKRSLCALPMAGDAKERCPRTMHHGDARARAVVLTMMTGMLSAGSTTEGCAPGVRARVWLSGEDLGENDDFARVWLHLDDGQVRVFRLPASCLGCDEVLAPLMAASAADARGMLLEVNDRLFEWAIALYAAPVAPLLRSERWSRSHAAALSFSRGLDAELLEVLGQLQAQRTWGSARNYTRLAILPPEVRQRRLQAITRFPLLVAPVLLSGHHRLELFGGKRHAWRAHDDEVVEAIDRGRDLTGVLAAHHGVSRALVRSPTCRQMWGSTALSHQNFLRLMDALRPEQRPARWAEISPFVPALPALESLAGGTERLIGVARDVFRPGWTALWRACEQAFAPLPAAVSDAEDFVRAAAGSAANVAGLSEDELARAWLRERGLLPLLRASARWHAARRPTPRPIEDGETLPAVIGLWEEGVASATELTTASALTREGDDLDHCVADYWSDCRDEGTRIFALSLPDDERATAQYNPRATHGDVPDYGLVQLRGPGNAACGAAMQAWAERVEDALNEPQRRAARAAALATAGQRRRSRGWWMERVVGPLDPESEKELTRVLARHAARPENRPLPGEVLRAWVAGFAYHDGASVQAQLSIGRALELVREPDNPHDPLAVRIDGCGVTLGYVPRALNAAIAARLDAGEVLVCQVVECDPRAEPWTRLVFAIAAEAGMARG